MASEVKHEAASKEFLDANQYSLNSILRYERIFGYSWVSVGGEYSTKEFSLHFKLKPGQKVLDIGCGTGGSAFFMARQFGVSVHGIDLSSNMLSIAKDRISREEKLLQERVMFTQADILEVEYPDNEFDLVYSRDVFLHIKDKEFAFKRILPWLKPGGRLLISDYLAGDQKHSADFKEYVKQRGYHLKTLSEYSNVLKRAGFGEVEAHDVSSMFLKTLKFELKYFIPTKETFIKDFSDEDFQELVEGWNSKIKRIESGDQAWGLFICNK